MKLYRTKNGIIVEEEGLHWNLGKEDWDSYVNDDALHHKLSQLVLDKRSAVHTGSFELKDILPPIQSQELWAAGVTYLRSKVGRQEESNKAGSGDFYARVYEAERPELFFKGTSHRIAGQGGCVRIRKDSSWNVPEPELTLMITSSEKIVGYTIGNDMSSRSIEGENPLYLPQAKTYDGCAALGPCIYVTERPLGRETAIRLEIARENEVVLEGSVTVASMKRSFEEMVSFLYRECSFPYGSLLMTGTGIVPTKEFTLHEGDTIRITIDPIGTLVNVVA